MWHAADLLGVVGVKGHESSHVEHDLQVSKITADTELACHVFLTVQSSQKPLIALQTNPLTWRRGGRGRRKERKREGEEEGKERERRGRGEGEGERERGREKTFNSHFK